MEIGDKNSCIKSENIFNMKKIYIVIMAISLTIFLIVFCHESNRKSIVNSRNIVKKHIEGILTKNSWDMSKASVEEINSLIEVLEKQKTTVSPLFLSSEEYKAYITNIEYTINISRDFIKSLNYVKNAKENGDFFDVRTYKDGIETTDKMYQYNKKLERQLAADSLNTYDGRIKALLALYWNIN